MSQGLFNLKKALQVFGLSTEDLSGGGFDESSLPAFARSALDRLAS
jgi:hypothetical protein